MIPLHDDNPTEKPPVVTLVLIAACVLVFLWQVSHGPQDLARIVYGLGVIPAVLLDRRELDPLLALMPAEMTILSSMFLHGGWMHLIGNMLYLWIFGNNVEDVMGHGRFVLFYLLCGLGAAFAQVFAYPDSTVPMVGASGAISGVLGAYLLLFPFARVLVVVPLGFLLYTVRLPALVVLGFWFVIQLLSSLGAPAEGGGVAFLAHIGGFVAGMMLIPLFKRRSIQFFQPPRSRGLIERR